jgi:hypothetical protein
LTEFIPLKFEQTYVYTLLNPYYERNFFLIFVEYKLGVYLPKPTFSHGELYVFVSRVTSWKGLKVLPLDENRETTAETRNIVYQEIIANL